jgi:Copper type II ascorbate-dependent monooxygenase, C-terminal domain
MNMWEFPTSIPIEFYRFHPVPERFANQKNEEMVEIASCHAVYVQLTDSIPLNFMKWPNPNAFRFHLSVLIIIFSFLQIRDNNETQPIIVDSNIVPNYQEFRYLPTPVKALPGDQLIAECIYDSATRKYITLGKYCDGQKLFGNRLVKKLLQIILDINLWARSCFYLHYFQVAIQ